MVPRTAATPPRHGRLPSAERLLGALGLLERHTHDAQDADWHRGPGVWRAGADRLLYVERQLVFAQFHVRQPVNPVLPGGVAEKARVEDPRSGLAVGDRWRA